VRVSHAPEKAPVHPRAETKYVRVAALREPEPPRNPLRLSAAAAHPFENDREDDLRTVLPDVEGEEFIEEFGGKGEFREGSFTPVVHELAQRGGDYPEAKPVPVQKGIEMGKKYPASRRNRAERISEAKTVPGGIEPPVVRRTSPRNPHENASPSHKTAPLRERGAAKSLWLRS
jgi:hypothetical protein